MTYKTKVIEEIFHSRWNPEDRVLQNPIVSLVDVQQGIQRHNATSSGKPVSDRNPANFAKDFFRRHSAANRAWPRTVFEAGYTGRQSQSEGACFEFIPISEGQVEAVHAAHVPRPDQETRRVKIESVSLPLASKRLGRSDEPWLIRVLIKLRVFETHLALSSGHHIVQLDHLQSNVKLKGAEIDALFLGVSQSDDQEPIEVIVCCEAKSRRDDIVPHQILNGVKAAFSMGIEQDIIIPLAVKAIAPSQVYVVEFEPVHRSHVASTGMLKAATSAIYELVPPVKGIGR